MASGFNANGSLPKQLNTDVAIRGSREDQISRDYVPRIS